MSDKTLGERLQESRRRATEHVRQWPEWMRDAISTARIFPVALSNAPLPELARSSDNDVDR